MRARVIFDPLISDLMLTCSLTPAAVEASRMYYNTLRRLQLEPGINVLMGQKLGM